jgi:hypothetical protein
MRDRITAVIESGHGAVAELLEILDTVFERRRLPVEYRLVRLVAYCRASLLQHCYVCGR